MSKLLELGGLRVAYAAFEPFPNAKGSGTRMSHMLRALWEAGAEVRLFSLPGRGARLGLPSAIEQRTLHVAESNFLRRGEAFRDWLVRELIAFRPHVVHYRGIFEAAAAALYSDVCGARRVFEVNGLYSVELGYHYPAVASAPEFQRRLREGERRALEGADLVITQSRTTQQFLARRAPRLAERSVVLPNGADPPLAEPRARASHAPPRLLYAGTLAPWQGVLELLMAVRRVGRHRPVSLVLAGPVRRPWKRQLERVVRRLRLEGSVQLLGALERHELAQQILASDVCVAPLRRDVRNTEQGCSPIKLFEYMAAAKPIVATDLPCVREIVDHERSALLATSVRPSALAEPILRLLDAPELARTLGEQARQSLLASATWERRRQALCAAYRERLTPLVLASRDDPLTG